MGKLLAFLVEHAGLIEALYEVIASGADKADVERAIRATAIAASDAEMRRELDP